MYINSGLQLHARGSVSTPDPAASLRSDPGDVIGIEVRRQ